MAVCGNYYRVMWLQNEASFGNVMNCSAVATADTKIDNNRTFKQMPYGHWKRDKYQCSRIKPDHEF